ncbi:MAG: hypothetical protein IKT40_12100 [Bacilli bacterium]|nr:hypothetical protein [Bacilli bacterium]
MKGLYFYKLASPYAEDVTKDCKLTVNEIDHNFLTLKESTMEVSEKLVNNIQVDNVNGRLVLTLNDGEVLAADVTNFTKDFSVEYDKFNGAIYLHHDNIVDKIEGLVTEDNIVRLKTNTIVTDETLIGDNITDALGVSVVEKTAFFRPVERLIDCTKGENLPYANNVKKGDRYLSLEYSNPYGYLYNYKSATKIAEECGNGWRIPSKEDWDGMLNAIELCDEYRNHHLSTCNYTLGKVAGKLLKANHTWFLSESSTTAECGCGCSCGTEEFDIEMDSNEEEPKVNACDVKGVDSYLMTLLPAGYGDGCMSMDYFGTRCKYWTSTNTSVGEIYTKRFDYDKAGVVQISEDPESVCSLRLVKDYDGSNFTGVEYINSVPYRTVLMPSTISKTGYMIWMAENAAFSNSVYNTFEPNGGEGVSSVKVHYFNEWNGFEWVKKVVSNGDSFVIRNAFDGTKDNEFRLSDNELINVNILAFNSIADIYDFKLAENEAAIKALGNQIEEHVIELRKEINDEASSRAEADIEIKGLISEESIARINSDLELRTSISELRNKASEIENNLNNEINSRIENDTELLAKINKEIEERIELTNDLLILLDNNFGTF